jgi:hypothetical protein
MANVDDFDRFAVDNAVKNFVAIALHNFDPDFWIAGSLRGVRLIGYYMHTSVDRPEYVESAAWASLFEVSINPVNISKRLRSVSNFHSMP